jgi:ech hydrogenase subunit D
MSSQQYQEIPVENLLEKVRELKEKGCRLAQIGATTLADGLEVNYSLAHEADLINLRLQLPAQGARVPSISSIYWCAFIYENEMHDLFNIEISGMAVDFKGNFYNTAVQYPFGSPKAPTPRVNSGEKTFSKPAQDPAASGSISRAE